MSANDDLDWAFTMYSSFARDGGDERFAYIEVLGAPWSKSRPKFARRGGHVTTYQANDDRAAEERTARALRASVGEPFLGNVMLACRFYRADFQRIDADNLIKHVCDSANSILWADDSQATLVLGEVLYDAERPRTIIIVGNHASNLFRGDDRKRACEHCGEMYVPRAGASGVTQRFCGRLCIYAARRVVLVPIPCSSCGCEFKPATTTQRLCSSECRVASLTGQAKNVGRSRSSCATCGKVLAHYRGGRCRECWRAAPNFYVSTASGTPTEDA